MLNVERQKEIVDLLIKSGSVKVNDLSQRFNVGSETIRRDLKSIANKIDIKLIYGGAYLEENNNSSVHESRLSMKRKINFDKKQIIAKKAASLISEGDTIALNSGSTVEYILDYIDDNININIVTLNVNIATKACAKPNVKVHIPGGSIRGQSGMIVGPDSIEFIKSFNIDKCFFGVSAMSIDRGIMHPVLEEVEGNMALLSVSLQKYIVIDSSKLDKISLFSMSNIEDMDCIITDDELPQKYIEYMQRKKIKII